MMWNACMNERVCNVHNKFVSLYDFVKPKSTKKFTLINIYSFRFLSLLLFVLGFSHHFHFIYSKDVQSCCCFVILLRIYLFFFLFFGCQFYSFSPCSCGRHPFDIILVRLSELASSIFLSMCSINDSMKNLRLNIHYARLFSVFPSREKEKKERKQRKKKFHWFRFRHPFYFEL